MLRLALLSFRGDIFAALHAACVNSGHRTVVAIHERAHGRWAPHYPDERDMVAGILDGIPLGVDLLLPADSDGLTLALRGYQPDLLVVCGCSWRLSRQVLDVPRLGVLNVHPSLLPRHRGPAPLEWAIRSGDANLGVTIHWMTERIDAGNVIVQRAGPLIPEDPGYDTVWQLLAPVVAELLGEALQRVVEGCAGEPQNEEHATYAGVMEPGYLYVDWTQPARAIHNQVRTFHYSPTARGPVANIAGQWVHVGKTRLSPGHGQRVECGDGPIWILERSPLVIR